ncbi:MAG: hypothetical protein ABIP46_04220, partial [Polaromonas sp.]
IAARGCGLPETGFEIRGIGYYPAFGTPGFSRHPAALVLDSTRQFGKVDPDRGLGSRATAPTESFFPCSEHSVGISRPTWRSTSAPPTR